MKGIALHSVIPVRVNPAEEAEQETQMIFAQTCEIIEATGYRLLATGKWTHIRIDDDGEEGYVDTKMLTILSDQEWEEIKEQTSTMQGARVRMPMAYAVSENNGQTIPLTAGTRLPNYKDGEFSLLGVRFRIDPQMVQEKPMAMTEENILNTVRFFINTPYLWGGKNALGIDCSGFSQTIYSLFGIRLPRMARQQIGYWQQATGNRLKGAAASSLKAERQKEIALEDAQCGDLAFFDHANEDPSKTKIIHVGILLDKERIIHASGRVKVEKIDEHGIYSAELGRYTHHLAGIRRYEK